MMTVHEVSKITGVSIRTLHYYDEIGLLCPSQVTEAGYRMYDDTNMHLLQDIMLFRELEFSLQDIKKIISNPNFDKNRALQDQIELLKLKRDRIQGLIDYADELLRKGDNNMSFDAFDNEKINRYREMAKKVWGDTEAYKEYEEKEASFDDKRKRQNAEDMMKLFFEFGEMKNCEPGDDNVQAQVKKLQDFITENYYNCTNEILAGLGQMYVAGDEMTKNINVAGGDGCAEFVAEAIRIYCRQ